jgi:HAD superfamily hydrolase (TIGR01509 family)
MASLLQAGSSATHVADGKPAPDLFLAAAIELEVAPADCIVVEDSVPGIAAAVWGRNSWPPAPAP